MAKSKVKVISTHINNNYEAIITVRVCKANKEDKAHFNQLNYGNRVEIMRNIEDEVIKILAISDKWYSLNDVYIDYGSWYVTYTLFIGELSPMEMRYIQQDINVDIVDVVRGKKKSLL
jgi:hypothetical protein